MNYLDVEITEELELEPTFEGLEVRTRIGAPWRLAGPAGVRPVSPPHVWFDPGDRDFKNLTGQICCRDCGACKPRDEERAARLTCPGVVKVTLRGAAAN